MKKLCEMVLGVRRGGFGVGRWFLVAMMGVLGMGSLWAGEVEALTTLTAEQTGAISQNCGTIRQSLRSLQKADSKARVLLGTTYNTILTNYITPLNLRLVRNNYPASKLAALQSDFAEAKADFARTFVTYSQSLEELVAADCQGDAEGFYKQLEKTRAEREKMAKAVEKMNALVSTDVNLVKALREEVE